jgi:protein-L-isoaspartate O-methyltransferase
VDIRQEADRILKRFEQLPGSEHIASAHAVEGLFEWLEKRQPETVLEMGAGIGTLTAALLVYQDQRRAAGKDARILCVEDHPFCLEQLARNMAEHAGRYEVIANVGELPADVKQFDFVIVDGGEVDERYFTRLSPGATVFVEGHRSKYRELLEQANRGRKWIRANIRSTDKSAGYWLYRFEPGSDERLSFFQANVAYGVRVRIKRLKKRLSPAQPSSS